MDFAGWGIRLRWGGGARRGAGAGQPCVAAAACCGGLQNCGFQRGRGPVRQPTPSLGIPVAHGNPSRSRLHEPRSIAGSGRTKQRIICSCGHRHTRCARCQLFTRPHTPALQPTPGGRGLTPFPPSCNTTRCRHTTDAAVRHGAGRTRNPGDTVPHDRNFQNSLESLQKKPLLPRLPKPSGR